VLNWAISVLADIPKEVDDSSTKELKNNSS
jgi:hypothetical protein